MSAVAALGLARGVRPRPGETLRDACRRVVDAAAPGLPGLGAAVLRRGGFADASPHEWEAGGDYGDRGAFRGDPAKAVAAHRVILELATDGLPLPSDLRAACVSDCLAEDGDWLDPLVGAVSVSRLAPWHPKNEATNTLYPPPNISEETQAVAMRGRWDAIRRVAVEARRRTGEMGSAVDFTLPPRARGGSR